MEIRAKIIAVIFSKYFFSVDAENDILNALKNSHLTFKNVFDELKTKLITSNFSSQYCREKNIIYLRMETGMSRTDFAKYFNIPYRTLENWERKDNKCPTYLYDLIEYKIINGKVSDERVKIFKEKL